MLDRIENPKLKSRSCILRLMAVISETRPSSLILTYRCALRFHLFLHPQSLLIRTSEQLDDIATIAFILCFIWQSAPSTLSSHLTPSSNPPTSRSSVFVTIRARQSLPFTNLPRSSSGLIRKLQPRFECSPFPRCTYRCFVVAAPVLAVLLKLEKRHALDHNAFGERFKHHYATYRACRLTRHPSTFRRRHPCRFFLHQHVGCCQDQHQHSHAQGGKASQDIARLPGLSQAQGKMRAGRWFQNPCH